MIVDGCVHGNFDIILCDGCLLREIKDGGFHVNDSDLVSERVEVLEP